MGATQAAAGILAPHIEVRSHTAFLDLAVRSLSLFDDFVARVQADSGIAVLVPAHRHASGGDERRRDARAEERRSAARGAGRRRRACSMRRRSAPKSRISATMSSAAWSCRRTVSSAAGELSARWRGAARRHGAQVIEGSRVRRIASVNGDRRRRNRSRIARRIGGRARRGKLVRADRDRRAAARVPVRPIRGQLLRWPGKGRRFAA